jgi:hypothetical protein
MVLLPVTCITVFSEASTFLKGRIVIRSGRRGLPFLLGNERRTVRLHLRPLAEMIRLIRPLYWY